MRRVNAPSHDARDGDVLDDAQHIKGFSIQRRITGRDGARWRSMCYVAGNPLPAMSAAVALAKLSDPPLELRVMAEEEDGVVRQVHAWTSKDGWI